MYKKSFILVSVVFIALCIFSSFVYATDNAKNAISNVTNTVVDGAVRLGDDVRNGVGAVENGVEDALTMDNNNENNNNNNDDNNNNDNNNDNNNGIITDVGTDNNGDYGTTRTTADATTTDTDNTGTLWTWLIVAIGAIVIIGLVWYYGTQNRTHRDE